MKTDFVKVNEELGIVFGWAIVCKVAGEDYYDLQGDHIPEESMLKATSDFACHSRVAGEMHSRELVGGSVPFIFPMTEEIAKSLGVTTENTGLIIGMMPNDDEVLQKFKDGTYTGFSIGGAYLVNEAVED